MIIFVPLILDNMDSVSNLVALGEKLKNNPALSEQIELVYQRNNWFTPEFSRYAIENIINYYLQPELLNEWLAKYRVNPVTAKGKSIGLIFAGNVPLVGFHDFMCAYVSGYDMQIKLSSKDADLFPFILEVLNTIDKDAVNRIKVVERLAGYNAVIATGSNNTNRYFEYYFKDYPRLLRKNRNSVALLTGNESPEQLKGLADDMFLYFGFGCRNVSKLYMPVGYDITQLFEHFDNYKWMHNHTRYMNNYDYNRTILLLNKTPHFSNDYIMLLEHNSIPSPISVIHYSTYHDINVLRTHLKEEAEKIQCIVGDEAQLPDLQLPLIPFGDSQKPKLDDYADGVDTMKFLQDLPA
jgi:hypothetical protein